MARPPFGRGPRPKNGAGRVRTGDPLLAKQVLYQLSYDPVKVGKKLLYKEREL